MTTKTMTGTVIDGQIDRPKITTALPGPHAKRVLAGDDQFISPSYTRSYPLVAKEGHGIVVTDVDGNEFFDFSSGIAVTSTGHCHPDVVAAIRKQAGELIHMSGTDFYYESLVTLADQYGLEIVPEVQSLTHSYYIASAHRELAEDPDMTWPDSYCPSNPDSYKLLFEILDEYIDAHYASREEESVAQFQV